LCFIHRSTEADIKSQTTEKHQDPLTVIHRGDLQRILFNKAKTEKIDIRLNSSVTQADPNFEARVQLPSGEWIGGHVLIVADGAKSRIRQQMLEKVGEKESCSSTGDSAYRVLIPRDRLENDKCALTLLDSNIGIRWIGPGGHVGSMS
jgi:salicylate hydroxylase